MEETGERVKTLEEALLIMDRALAKNERNVLVGYEVLRILDILRESALKVGKEKVVERVEGVEKSDISGFLFQVSALVRAF